ncbi:hypothetical protein F5884DRAFT_266211 [Xylogone sp. PMI_703]|nr:hypothetical protein F5884DRAFT_266211 [Xylogone sp. PMI_703]
MPVHHVALYRLKSTATEEQVAEWIRDAENMGGKMPGLISINMNRPIKEISGRTQGYDLCLIAVFESKEKLMAAGSFPGHDDYARWAPILADGTLVFNMEC